MDRRTENHRPTLSLARPWERSALLVSTLVLSSMLMTSAGGCKVIRERRAQRAAERQAGSEQAQQVQQANEARQLPNGQARPSSESQESWMNRQPIVQGESTPSNPVQADDQHDQHDQPHEKMVIVDDRPSSAANTGQGQSDEPAIDIIESSAGGLFNRQSPEQASYARAVELHASGDLEAALRELERAIANNPQFTRAFLEAGDIYLEMAQYEIAERQFARAVRVEPRNFMAQYRHGQVLHRLGQLEEANRAFLRALSIRPADYDANIGISIVLLELGRVEQALPYGQRAVRSEPPSGRARMHLGNVYAALDRHEEAVIEYQQAAELMDAPTPGLLLNMAESLNQLKRYAEMVGALDQLVRIEPDAIAYERLGSGLFRLRRYDESLAAFGKSADMEPTHYPAFNGIAVCELNHYLWSSKTDAGARKRAVEAMRKSLRLERKQARIVELLRRYSKPSSTEK